MWTRLVPALAIGIAAAAPPALAQMPCAKREMIVKTLDTRFGETRVARGLQSEKRLFEFWRSTESGSWTILMVMPDGTACVVVSGEAWLDDDVEPPGSAS
jgi:hypothetical protein